ncbi:MAG TPA: hypothetical protein VJV79_39435 [Polyangiaceae bacterium]|nr:hypothetical protein [Polyangiaceae bacterium]
MTSRPLAPWLFALLSALPVLGCSHTEDVIVQTGAGNEPSAIDIDKEPLALLPGGVVGIASLNAAELVASPFGGRLLALLNQRLPIPPSAGFDPARDLSHLYLGLYSMQGADLSGVALGKFDKPKIEAAVNGVEKTPQGVPIAKRQYAGRTLYTAAGFGFCLLSDRTALFGNDTGIRRALDRVREGRVRRQTLPWMDKLLDGEKSAPIVAGADLRGQAIPEAASRNVAFLNGLETLAFVGNFKDPGVNLAGTLVYGDAAGATQGAQNVQALAQKLGTYGTLLALVGFPQPVRQLQAEAKDKQAAFVAGLDGAALLQLLDKLPEYLGSKGLTRNP